MTIHRYRLGALVLLGLHLSACATWQPVPLNRQRILEEQQPGRVRIRQADGTRLELRNPRVERDSLIASVRASSAPLGAGTVRIPLAEVRGLEIHHFDIWGTLGLIVEIPFGLSFACAAGLICGGLQ